VTSLTVPASRALDPEQPPAMPPARSGKDPQKLDVFFREWLYTGYPSNGQSKPMITPDNFETYVP
jgi:hypothetical protein